MAKGNSAIVVGVGADPGIGAAVARRLAQEGLEVFVGGRSMDRLDTFAAKVSDAGGGTVTAVQTDTTNEQDVAALFDAAEASGPIDFVCYNAGNNFFGPFREMEVAFFEDVWRVGCLGGFLVGREAARRMTPRGGTLIFTGASASLRGRPPFAAFASAKAGLRAVAQAMAREFGPEGLHVAHVIIDGGVDGDLLHERFPQMVEERGAAGLLDTDAVADNYWNLHTQHKTTWTFEIDLRPFKETF
jgi:NAD(P)-dependent dehydrogenase (short-subunit alcohol dehydrogenase family)